MSTHVSPETALKSLLERLKSLRNYRYNVNAHLLSIRQEARMIIGNYAFISHVILQGLSALRNPMNGCPLLMSLNPQQINGVISECRFDLEYLEGLMREAMRDVRGLRKIVFQTEEEIRKVEDEVAIGMADRYLEETRTLRTVGLFHPSTGGN